VVVKVEIWLDVVCPWCYLGRRRFASALRAFPNRDEVEVVVRSFELDPDAEGAPEPTVDVLARKFRRSASAILPMFEQVTALAKEEGLAFDLPGTLSGNTFDAHRMLHFARTVGRDGELLERLSSAYFTQRRSLFDHGALVELAEESGMDGAQARAVLDSDAFGADVRTDEAQARAYGASGVPFFVVDGRYGISGAQPVEAFTQTLATAWATREPVER
jgi:predicted DsbA family dithiol-disulfide isomerase